MGILQQFQSSFQLKINLTLTLSHFLCLTVHVFVLINDGNENFIYIFYSNILITHVQLVFH